MIKQKKIDYGMKPFDLEKAKAGKPVCTRDGRKARILCFDLDNEDYKIAAAISMDNHKGEKVETYTIDGRCEDINIKKSLDLMMVSGKKKGWINVYRDVNTGKPFCDCEIYDSKDDAISNIQGTAIGTFPFKWED